MNTRFILLPVLGACIAPVATAAVLYTDVTGENFDGNPHMDIVSVNVSHTLTTITFDITLNGSITGGTNWGKYCVGISDSLATGDVGNPVGNPWGRNIRMAEGMDAWIGSWVDGTPGAQAWTYAGGSWAQNATVSPTVGSNSTSITFLLADLGLSYGDTIQFDVYTTGGGGGDSANDALANPAQTVNDWQVPYTTPSSGPGASLTYVIPEPSAALLGLVGALGLARRRR